MTAAPDSRRNLSAVLAILFVAFVAAYLAQPWLPGGSGKCLGWWGWFDQGKYLQSAKALAAGNFSRDLHFYPPLYPMLGALFVAKWPLHPFFFVDAACFLFVAYGFIRFAERYVAWWIATITFTLTVVLTFKIFQQYAIPWTSTPTAALFVGAMLICRRIAEWERPRFRTFVAFGLLAGALVPLRPVDTFVLAPFWLLVMKRAAQTLLHAENPKVRHAVCANVAGLFLASLLGPALFVWFNLKTTGTPLGSYIYVASANGFHIANFAQKFVSIFYSGQPLYLEHGTGILQRYPWVWIAGLGGLMALANGPAELRAVVAAMCIQLAIYLPYNDLLPNGLWRYSNIHYFKWMFPFWGLFAVLAIKGLWQAALGRRRWKTALAMTLLVGVSSTVGLKGETVPATTSIRSVQGRTLVDVHPSLANGAEVDYVDFYGASGTFTDIYFGQHLVNVDGRKLKPVADFRLLPASWGARLLFIRPLRPIDIYFEPANGVNLPTDPAMVAAGEYRFRLGAPMAFAETSGEFGVGAPYALGSTISFRMNGNATPYIGRGWSAPEPGGRWTDESCATLGLGLRHKPPRTDLRAVIDAMAFVNAKHPNILVTLEANGREVGKRLYSAAHGGAVPSTWKVVIPRGTLKRNPLVLRFRISRPASPQRLGLSADTRKLGLEIKSLTLIRGTPSK